jgi:hypothetical protein
VYLTGRQQKLHRVAEAVAGRVNLRAKFAAPTTELLFLAFFERPLHERERE